VIAANGHTQVMDGLVDGPCARCATSAIGGADACCGCRAASSSPRRRKVLAAAGYDAIVALG